MKKNPEIFNNWCGERKNRAQNFDINYLKKEVYAAYRIGN